MFPPEFDYYRAGSVAEAIDLLDAHAEADPALLAGGHGLLPAMKTGDAAPEVVVDVSEIGGLRGIETGDSGDSSDFLRVGALTTHAALADAPAVAERASLLAEAADRVADTQIRNRGTVGGNLAEAHPAADLPPAMVAADALLVLRGPDGEREIPAAEFFDGDGETAIRDRELLTEIRVPSEPSAGGAYAKKTDPASGYALVGVAARLLVDEQDDEWVVTDARVAATGVTDRPERLESVEEAVVGETPETDAPARAAEVAADDLDPSRLRSDASASGEFRAHLVSSYAERALERAMDRAIGRPRGRETGQVASSGEGDGTEESTDE